MPRPKSRPELLAAAQTNYDKLLEYVDSFSPEEQIADFPPGTLNRNIRDVLAHLHHWHLMFMDWYTVGMSGAKPDIPARGYTWKTTPDLNAWINEKYRGMDLAEARKRLTESHDRVYALIEKHTDDELFTKKRYQWTGTTSLGAYLISATSSHYDWARKLIRRAKK